MSDLNDLNSRIAALEATTSPTHITLENFAAVPWGYAHYDIYERNELYWTQAVLFLDEEAKTAVVIPMQVSHQTIEDALQYLADIGPVFGETDTTVYLLDDAGEVLQEFKLEVDDETGRHDDGWFS